MPEYTYSDELYSDFHKDAYGFRPRNGGVHNWDNLNPAEKQLAWESMDATLEIHHQEIEYNRACDLTAFHKLIKTTILAGAKDVETALRWIMESGSYKVEEILYPQDVDSFLWDHGISSTPYGCNLSKRLLKDFRVLKGEES